MSLFDVLFLMALAAAWGGVVGYEVGRGMEAEAFDAFVRQLTKGGRP